MNTITLYKVVFVNEYGDIEDYDLQKNNKRGLLHNLKMMLSFIDIEY